MRSTFWLGAAIVAMLISPGCSCGADDTTTGSSAGVGGQGGAGGGTTSTSGTGMGGGGQGGSGPLLGGPATETVSAGDVAQSPNYLMVFTFGQSTQDQGTSTSPGYRMQGGLIGATESLP